MTYSERVLLIYLVRVFLYMLNQEAIQSAKSEGRPHNRKEQQATETLIYSLFPSFIFSFYLAYILV